MTQSPRLVYVCSPLRATETRSMAQHLADAERYEAQVFEAGHLALTPHLILTRHLDDTDPRQRALGIELALRYLDRADEVWAFGSRFSEGMKGELMYAVCTGKPAIWYPCGEVSPDGIRLEQELLTQAFRDIRRLLDAVVASEPAAMGIPVGRPRASDFRRSAP